MSLVTKSFSKETLDEVFPNPPIREVAFEVRFAPRLRVNAELWKIQDGVVNEYPNVGTESVLQPSGGMLTVNVFQNPIAARVIKISQENFVVAFTKYSRFEDFKEEVVARANQFCSQFEVTSLQRVGLRYVNNILIPATEQPSELLRYVRPLLDFERVSIESVGQFVTEVRLAVRKHLITVRGALLAPVDGGRRVYVLDIDCHTQEVRLAKEIPELLDIFHDSAQLFFLDHVTEEYKNVMRGK